MILSGIMTVVVSIIWNCILYQLGQILTESEQIRHFLGLKTDETEKLNYQNITHWIELTGKLLMIYAVISMIGAIIGGLSVLSGF